MSWAAAIDLVQGSPAVDPLREIQIPGCAAAGRQATQRNQTREIQIDDREIVIKNLVLTAFRNKVR